MWRYLLVGGLLAVVACAEPTAPTTGDGFTASSLVAGGSATCTLQDDFALHCWGKFSSSYVSAPPDTAICGRFTDCYLVPTLVRPSFPVRSLQMGGDFGATHVCGVMHDGLTDGSVDCIGNFRALDDLIVTIGGSEYGAIRLPALATTVSAHWTHWCSLDPLGQAWCWGRFDYGKRGLPVFDGYQWDLDANVIDGWHFSAITVGGLHTCGIEFDGLTYCWGKAALVGRPQPPTAPPDQCFSGPDCVLDPVPLVHQLRFRSIEAGGVHTCGLTDEGDLYCWGGGSLGQLGGGTSDSPAPVRVGLPEAAMTFAVGSNHSCAVTTSGRTYCWGSSGALGLGGRTAVSPTPVDGDRLFIELAAGNEHTCGRDSEQRIWCWGSNRFGALGTGDTVSRARPTLVMAP
jgi:alpha-tubulin suppressor-like RCC1 family protein